MPTNTKQKRTKRQHYVARSFLRAFEDDNRGIYRLDKLTGKVIRTGVNAVGFQNDFYNLTIPAPGEKHYEFLSQWTDLSIAERILQYFESDFLRLRREIIVSVNRGEEARVTRQELAMHLVVQWLRTPAAREEFRANSTNSVQALVNELVRRNFPGQERFTPSCSISEDMLLHMQLKTILDEEFVSRLGSMICQHHWALAIAPPHLSLIVSDQPVVRRPHVAGQGPWSGFASTGIELSFPLSKAMALWIREPTFHGLTRESDGSTHLLCEEQVRYLNRLQVFGSKRFLFGSHADWGVIQDFLECNPQLKSGSGIEWKAHMHAPKDPEGMRQDIETWAECVEVDWI